MNPLVLRVSEPPSLLRAPWPIFGVATYYHNPNHGGLIAAHLTLPFGTRVQVYNLDTGRNVVVTIVDRGPHARGQS